MIKGEMMVPTRAAIEQQPMAMFLITVGKSSEETAYTTQNDDVTPNFPNISSSTATTGKSGETTIQHHKLKTQKMSDGSKKMQRYHSTVGCYRLGWDEHKGLGCPRLREWMTGRSVSNSTGAATRRWCKLEPLAQLSGSCLSTGHRGGLRCWVAKRSNWWWWRTCGDVQNWLSAAEPRITVDIKSILSKGEFALMTVGVTLAVLWEKHWHTTEDHTVVSQRRHCSSGRWLK